MAEERIDPNRADLETLRQLPGIGAELAQRILDRRPYGSPEDLLAVPGLGAGTLERIRPKLRVETPAEPDAEAAPEGEIAPEPVRRSAAGFPSSWAVLAVAAASVLCSVSLTLVVFLGINGTLDYGRHAAVRRIDSRLSQAESDLSSATSEIHAVRQRLEVIEGLSGRMAELESRMDQAQQQLETVDGELAEIRQQLEALQQQSDRIDRIEAFFLGLQELLGQWFPAPEG